MTRYLIFTLLTLAVSMAFADRASAVKIAAKPQTPAYTMQEMQAIADSILMEGDLLAVYESVAWNAGDVLRGRHGDIAQNVGDYLVYRDENGDTKAIFSDRTSEELRCIYTFILSGDPENPNPVRENTGARPFTELEKELWNARESTMRLIDGMNIDFEMPAGFSFNHILLPMPFGYRYYLICGTSQHGIIPFGNDYFFDVDFEGNVIRWRKMHSQLLPTSVSEGFTMEGTVLHSHLKEEPFITPTDICTFRLYAPFFNDIKTLIVFSAARPVYFEFNLDTNTISIKDIFPEKKSKKNRK
jgi:hypothetical protein